MTPSTFSTSTHCIGLCAAPSATCAHGSLSPPLHPAGKAKACRQRGTWGPQLASPSPEQRLEGDAPGRCHYLCRRRRSPLRGLWLLRCTNGARRSQGESSGNRKQHLARTENWGPGQSSPLAAGDTGGGSRHSGPSGASRERAPPQPGNARHRRRGCRRPGGRAWGLHRPRARSSADFTSRSHDWVVGSEESPSVHRKDEDKATRATGVRSR